VGGREEGEGKYKKKNNEKETKGNKDLTVRSPDLILWKFSRSLQISSYCKQLKVLLNVANE